MKRTPEYAIRNFTGVTPNDIGADIAFRGKRSLYRQRLKIWLQNAPRLHERLLVRYLRRRGWIVFWLDHEARHCSARTHKEGVCWLQTYLGL